MKIDKTSSAKPVSAASKKKKTGGTGSSEFSTMVDSTEDVDQGQGVSASAPVSAIDALLATQEMGGEGGQQQAKNHGYSMLDLLDEVRMGLLLGQIPVNRLENLRKMVENKRQFVTDDHMDRILKEIELRVRVELAKLGM